MPEEDHMTTPVLLVMVPYAAIAVILTIWLARQLSRHGLVFLRSVFAGRDDMALAINQLLVIGFYLVNLGWALLLLRADTLTSANVTEALSMLVDRLGILLLLLGIAHLVNLYVFHRIRRGVSAA
jgi:hypothetical protein